MMTAKEHLESYKRAVRHEERCKEELTELETRWTSATALLTGMPRGTTKRDLSDYAVQLERITQRLTAVPTSSEIRAQIQDCLDSMTDETEKDVLYYRYILGWSWCKIADKIYHDERYTYRIHKRALEHYQEVMMA